MIPNGEGWHYLAVKTLSALIRRIMSKHHCDCYCLNCLHFLQQKTNANLKKKKKKKKKIIIIKLTFVIYLYIECLIEKIDGCKNNPPN